MNALHQDLWPITSHDCELRICRLGMLLVDSKPESLMVVVRRRAGDRYRARKLVRVAGQVGTP